MLYSDALSVGPTYARVSWFGCTRPNHARFQDCWRCCRSAWLTEYRKPWCLCEHTNRAWHLRLREDIFSNINLFQCMTMPKVKIRFGISGNNGQRSSIWTCWTNSGTNKNDVFLICHELQGVMKLSLHQSGHWHVAFERGLFPTLFDCTVLPSSRFILESLKPLHIGNGLNLVCRIHIPWFSITIPVCQEDQKITWLDAPNSGEMSEVVLLVSDQKGNVVDWPGKNPLNTQFVGVLDLDNGHRMWLVHRNIQFIAPNISCSVAPNYFRGKNESDLISSNIRGVVVGKTEDGCVAFFEGPVEMKRIN